MRHPGAPRLATGTGLLVVLAGLTGCVQGDAEAEPDRAAPTTSTTTTATTPPAPAASGTTAPPTTAPAAAPTSAPAGPATSDGTPQRAVLAIPAIGLRGLVVQPYVGRTDDAAGTELQDGGIAASPHGRHGGTGPGGVGSYQVTAHRNTAGGPFGALPDVRRGDRVSVTAAGTTWVYEITGTLETSFRSAASLRAQRAPVPGSPGQAATQAMILLSTCATQEDHAAGNYWADELDNPEHRIDKVGVLVATRPAA